MLRSRYIDKIVLAVILLLLALTAVVMNWEAIGLKPLETAMGYEDRLFDNTKVHTINIVMDDWDDLIASAESEEYYDTTLVIDGETFKNAAIRGKGNTSLSTVSSMDSDRYSFKVEFDHYDDALTYHGLDKLSLNNLIQDATMMKDYLTYAMMREFDAAAPLCSFVYITVNGEDWGLYLAVEGVEDSFLERNYGSDYGELYKPDAMNFGGGRGNGKDFNPEAFMNGANPEGVNKQSKDAGIANEEQTWPQMPEGFNGQMPQAGAMPDMSNFDPSQMPNMENFDSSQMPAMPQGGFDSESFTPPANGEMPDFGKGGFGGMGAADVKLQYVDDNIDSYTNIWNSAKTDITTADQNRLIASLKKLSSGEDIESVVNVDAVIRYFVVHNYVCNGDSYTGAMIHNYYLYEEDGQLAMLPWDYNLAFGTFRGGNGQNTINTPIDSPVSGSSADRPMWNWIAANEEYTEQYHQYYEEFLNTVDVQSIIDNAYTLIKPYVEKDPTAFYSIEEFETGVETLRQFCKLRSESISMQLANGETVNNMNYVDASGLTLSDMGTMGRGGMGGNMPNMGDKNAQQNGNRPSFGNKQPPGGDVSFEVAPMDGENPQTEATPQAGTDRTARGDMRIPGQNNPEASGANLTGWLWIAGSVLILAVGIFIAKMYKR